MDVLTDTKTPHISCNSISHQDDDEAVLARFQKKQRLQRRFGTFSAIGVSCTIMLTWEALTADILPQLQNGGPAGCVIMYLIAWAGAALQAAVFAELSSMVPLAGGPFNWVAIFSPPWCKKFLSYLAGWLTLISYMALVAGTCYITGTMIQGLVALQYPAYSSPSWQSTLIYYAALFLCISINTFLGKFLPQIESGILLLHILAFVGILIAILSKGNFTSAREIFTVFLDTGGWDSKGLAVLVGSSTMLTTFCGLDGADHIAEEMHNAAKTVPIAIGSSVLINGLMGFATLMSLLFCMPSDLSGLLRDYPQYPFIGIYTHALESSSGAIGLAVLIIATNTISAVSIIVTCSRMVWAFAREGGLPGSRFLSRVDPKTRLPLWSIGCVLIVNLLIGLINIGSTVGFTALISLIVAGYYSSFVLASGVMLYKRLTVPDSEIPWGPFRLGRAGVPITVVAMAYSAVGAFFSLWPAQINPTIENMNYCVIVYGGILLFSLAFWFLHGRKRYTGPVIEL